MADSPHPKKSLGQHWLNDRASLQAMCDAAELESSDIVLEIGPGLGTLTELLVGQSKRVVAVEFDEHLARALPIRVPVENLEVVSEDILRFDFGEMPPDYKLVANIPYYLTSNLIRVLSESPNPPSKAVLLVQKEVAQRVVAGPGQMSLLSVTAQFYWHVEAAEIMPAYLFTPPPKVDSQILILTRRSEVMFSDIDTASFFRVIKAGFSQRRKTLLNALSSGLHLTKPETQSFLEKAAIDPKLRPQNLSLDNWYELYKVLTPTLET